jgi:hypothetical protein
MQLIHDESNEASIRKLLHSVQLCEMAMLSMHDDPEITDIWTRPYGVQTVPPLNEKLS